MPRFHWFSLRLNSSSHECNFACLAGHQFEYHVYVAIREKEISIQDAKCLHLCQQREKLRQLIYFSVGISMHPR
jgi:hypothetical protein